MTEEQLDELGPALEDFLRPYLFCCGYTQSFAHLRTYCRGLLSELKRKSVEPIALASGCAVRTLQEFLRDHQWQHTQVREQLQRHVGAELAGLPDDGLGNVGVIDETASVKDGTKTPGVKRQWCGYLGKKENCVVTVHLGVCRGRYKTLIDNELFLPEDWAADRKRRRKTQVPKEVVFQEKWRIALDLLDRSGPDVPHGWVVGDDEFGRATEFRAELRLRHER